MRKNIYLWLAVSVCLLANRGFSQGAFSNARSMGLAGAYSSLARGAHAAVWNPANLGLVSSPGFSLQFPAIGLRIYNSSFGLAEYNRYNGAALTETDKQDILNKISDAGLKLFLNSGANLLGFSIHRFAILAGIRAASDLTLSRDIADLILNGNTFERTYDFSQTRGRGWGMASVSLSYGQPIYLPMFQDFAVGATFHWLKGMGYAEVVSASGKFTTDFNGFYGDGHAEIRTALWGSGMAFDLGAAGTWRNHWRFSVLLKNVAGSIRWTDEVKLFTYGVQTDTLTAQNLAESDADSLVDDVSEERDGEPFDTRLPFQLRLGTAYTTRLVNLSFELLQSFSEAPGVGSNMLMAFGTEFKWIKFLPLRAGFAVGGNSQFMTGLGLGLKIGAFSMNWALQSYKSLLPASGSGIGLGFDMTIGM